MKQSKKFLAGVISSACLVGLFPVSSLAATENVSVQEQTGMKSNGTINTHLVDSTVSADNKVRESQIVVDGVKHVVNYNFNDGTVKIDGVLQEGLKATWDASKAARTDTQNKNSVMQRSAGSGYKYVGTISGHTKTAKGSAMIAALAAGFLPGMGIPVKAVIGILNIYAALEIPMAYYTYDLYEKNPLTNDWYQYAVVKFYEDEAHTKRVGPALTGQPFKVYLPNS